VVALIDAALLAEKCANALGAFVQLGARQRHRHNALGVEKREDHVIGSTLRAPLEDFAYKLVLRTNADA